MTSYALGNIERSCMLGGKTLKESGSLKKDGVSLILHRQRKIEDRNAKLSDVGIYIMKIFTFNCITHLNSL